MVWSSESFSSNGVVDCVIAGVGVLEALGLVLAVCFRKSFLSRN